MHPIISVSPFYFNDSLISSMSTNVEDIVANFRICLLGKRQCVYGGVSGWVRLCACTYACACMQVGMCVCVHPCMCVCMCF